MHIVSFLVRISTLKFVRLWTLQGQLWDLISFRLFAFLFTPCRLRKKPQIDVLQRNKDFVTRSWLGGHCNWKECKAKDSKVFTDIHRRGHPKTSIQNRRLGDFLIQCALQSLYECRNALCFLLLASFTLTNGCNWQRAYELNLKLETLRRSVYEEETVCFPKR
jgi:hypothetical protein